MIKQFFRELLLPLSCMEVYVGREEDWGFVWSFFGSRYMLEVVMVYFLTDIGC